MFEQRQNLKPFVTRLLGVACIAAERRFGQSEPAAHLPDDILRYKIFTVLYLSIPKPAFQVKHKTTKNLSDWTNPQLQNERAAAPRNKERSELHKGVSVQLREECCNPVHWTHFQPRSCGLTCAASLSAPPPYPPPKRCSRKMVALL